jgi:hypothetical protein
VEEDEHFLPLYRGQTLTELAQFGLGETEVDGVSGATMTSRALARGLVGTAQALMLQKEAHHGRVTIRLRDVTTIALVLLGMVMAFSKLRGQLWLRRAFQVVLILVLGFLNGDMLSQALLVGWAQHGVPWARAPGLVILTLAALLLPLATRRQVYCHHLCPHGAAQQLLKKAGRSPVRISRRILRILRLLPGALLIWVLLVAMRPLPFSLVSIEPFDAYLIRVAGWATLSVFFAGLVAAFFVPMAYCRYGCPTGAVLDFLWAHGNARKFTRRDTMALGLLILALCLWWLGA